MFFTHSFNRITNKLVYNCFLIYLGWVNLLPSKLLNDSVLPIKIGIADHSQPIKFRAVAFKNLTASKSL